jgi:hypothetical protein
VKLVTHKCKQHAAFSQGALQQQQQHLPAGVMMIQRRRCSDYDSLLHTLMQFKRQLQPLASCHAQLYCITT